MPFIPFAVLYGDDLMYTEKGMPPVTKQLADAYEKTGKLIIGCQSISREEATKYGVVKPGKVDGRLTEVLGFDEKPSIDRVPQNPLVSLGRYIITPDIFEVIEKEQQIEGTIIRSAISDKALALPVRIIGLRKQVFKEILVGLMRR